MQVEGQQCVNVPIQQCTNVPVTAPVEVPKQRCYKRPRKVGGEFRIMRQFVSPTAGVPDPGVHQAQGGDGEGAEGGVRPPRQQRQEAAASPAAAIAPAAGARTADHRGVGDNGEARVRSWRGHETRVRPRPRHGGHEHEARARPQQPAGGSLHGRVPDRSRLQPGPARPA